MNSYYNGASFPSLAIDGSSECNIFHDYVSDKSIIYICHLSHVHKLFISAKYCCFIVDGIVKLSLSYMWVDTVLQASAIILFLNDILALFPDLLVCKNEFCMDIQTSQELLQCTA